MGLAACEQRKDFWRRRKSSRADAKRAVILLLAADELSKPRIAVIV
jgi:hypothetical protein